ncbi:hypothetical protein QQS21_010484 [Conoideocrella luteorostrata]|uniref:Zn(2)-C6 fungal-type domain-containing protein n=1 Tax=Conoideocrella luteorostrata TaxID=1105319 RepID=A0AAJ0CJD5_9HYPO|nr:hypothetical protein QQS21_010484 [Conoideocrella luteorostrata]
MKKRISSSCDACAFRRVKCDAERPCHECRLRGLECTSLRTRGKRGPKGPRPATCRKIKEGLSRWTQNQDSPSSGLSAVAGSSPESASSNEVSVARGFAAPTCSRRLPVEAYCRYLGMFRDRLYPIWPVVDMNDLITKLIVDVDDLESYALAAAVCAASIAQLRLPEHTDCPEVPISSHQFAKDAEAIRELYDYRESHNLSSVLIPFFLHIYFANSSKLRTSAGYLRESIASVHWLGLDREDSYEVLELDERSLKLRVFWILFISERTFCAQNCFPAVLVPIEEMPPYGETDSGFSSITHAFSSLTRLFSHLQKNIFEPSSSRKVIMDPDKVATSQLALCAQTQCSSFTEIQQVDIFVTRQWIRLLIWEYTMRHYKMSRESSNQAFSLLLPVSIARELLSLFPTVSAQSIHAHGYGMELKVYRMADSLLDILACAPGSTRQGGMCVGMGDILGSLKTVLLDIGGVKSAFVDKLQTRMSTSELAKTSWPYLSMRPHQDSAQPQQERSVYEIDDALGIDDGGFDGLGPQ